MAHTNTELGYPWIH